MVFLVCGILKMLLLFMIFLKIMVLLVELMCIYVGCIVMIWMLGIGFLVIWMVFFNVGLVIFILVKVVRILDDDVLLVGVKVLMLDGLSVEIGLLCVIIIGVLSVWGW